MVMFLVLRSSAWENLRGDAIPDLSSLPSNTSLVNSVPRYTQEARFGAHIWEWLGRASSLLGLDSEFFSSVARPNATSNTDMALSSGWIMRAKCSLRSAAASRTFQSSSSLSLLLKACSMVKSLIRTMRSTETGTDPGAGLTGSMMSSLEFALSIAATMFLRMLAASSSGQSCRIILRRYASPPRIGCGWVKSCAWKVRRDATSAGNDSAAALRPLSALAGRSCTTKVRWGNSLASAIAAPPVDPTWMERRD